MRTTTSPINAIETGRKIKDLRIRRGVSVRELQDVFGFESPQAIYKWQHGEAMPTVDNLVILALALQVKVDEILVLNQ